MRLYVCLCVTMLVTGCAGRRVPTPPVSDARPSGAETAVPAPERAAAAPAAAQSLSTFIAKVRELSAQARPPRQSPATIETTDDRLREALAVQLAAPSPEHLRAVAAEYKRLGIFDQAHTYLNRALLLSPTDSTTHDVMARLWRDSGFPALGLADAHRAVFYAPHSPEARNTLGTILQAMGHRQLAKAEYQRALALAPAASYALNNLCYVALLDGQAQDAVSLCRRALHSEPSLTPARNNLALAYASLGHREAANLEFEAAGDPAAALFNAGMLHMARTEYRDAVKAFAAAHALRPTMTQALVRARQAASAAADAEE